MSKEITEGGVYPFYQIPIGSVINYHVSFVPQKYEKISADTIKNIKTDTATKIHLTTAKFNIISLT